jgi:hypothetical protein
MDSCINSPEPMRPSPLVVMYFDEAQVLSEMKAPPNPDDKSLLDVLSSVIDQIRTCPLIAIYLSTNSHLFSLAPGGQFARSARARENWEKLQAPITETPFDCAPGLFVQRKTLSLSQISSIEFMSKFGRPL